MVQKNIELNFNRIFTSSEAYSPNFIACLIEIAIKHAESIRLDSSAVGLACLNSLQQSFGIILLEEYLALNENGRSNKSISGGGRVDDDDGGDGNDLAATAAKSRIGGPPASKRMRMCETTCQNEEAAMWIELAKLYRSMNDYDSIKGIFAGSTKRKNIVTEFTKNGLEFESNSDYYKVYN